MFEAAEPKLTAACVKNVWESTWCFLLLSPSRGKNSTSRNNRVLLFLKRLELKRRENQIIICKLCSDSSRDFPHGRVFRAHRSFCSAGSEPKPTPAHGGHATAGKTPPGHTVCRGGVRLVAESLLSTRISESLAGVSGRRVFLRSAVA